MKLTPKQEKFCQCIVSGMSGKDSYIAAYNTTKATEQTIYTESMRLLKRDDITERIKELRQPIENTIANINISERQQQIDFIKQRIEICKRKEDENAIIRYTDMLNKIYNCYRDNDIDPKQDSNITAIDTETLKQLIQTDKPDTVITA